MTSQHDKAHAFRALHRPGDPLVLFNIWDAGSAKAVAQADAKALATGSWSVAAANGFADGEQLPLDIALANLRCIVAATDLPVTIDLESGYGPDSADVGRCVSAAIEAGAIGCNLEDSFPDNGRLREADDQTARLMAARSAAESADLAFFINARTDVFFQKPAPEHDESMVDDALTRAHAYAKAGADGLFVPGLINETLIARLAKASPLPINIMAGSATPSLARLSNIGVARVSHGPGPYLATMDFLQKAAIASLAR